MANDEKEITLNFIEDYKSFPQLWDQNHKFYTHKLKRQDGLQVLGTKYNLDIDGVKKKIKSLRSYFAREHHKVLKRNSEPDCNEIVLSPWFAYKHLLFTAESADSSTDTGELCIEEVKVELEETFENENCGSTQSTFMSEDEHAFAQPPIRKKRKNRKIPDKEEEACKCSKNSTEKIIRQDECTTYGQLVGYKIRNLKPLNRLLAQKRINNILFDLEMGQMSDEATTEHVSLTSNNQRC